MQQTTNQKTVDIQLSETGVDAPEQTDATSIDVEWCFEAEYYAPVDETFDADAVLETLEASPLVIDAFVSEKDNVEFTDLNETAVYRIKINGWCVGDSGKHACRVGFAHFGEIIQAFDGVLGLSPEFSQSVGNRDFNRNLVYNFI